MSFIQGIKRVAKGESNIDFVGRRKIWFAISAALILISLGGLFIKKLNLGLAFEGGSSFSVPVASGTEVTVPEVEDAVEEAGLPDPQVTLVRSEDRQFARVEAEDVPEATRARVVTALARVAGQQNADEVSVQNVGPTWGAQISRKALRALIVFLVLVVVYIALRFETKVAICAIVSLFHDLIISVGIYALVGFEVTPGTVVAYLTILGYSLYDSVVVFDKVRENQAALTASSRMTYSDMVNRSVNQTAMRSINTSLSSLLPVGALLFVGVYLFGAETLKDLALALFIGIGAGSYSSIFLGPPLLAILKEREPKYRQLAARMRTLGGPAPAAAGAGGGSMAMSSSAATASSAASDEPAADAPKRQQVRTQMHGSPRGRKNRGGKRRR